MCRPAQGHGRHSRPYDFSEECQSPRARWDNQSSPHMPPPHGPAPQPKELPPVSQTGKEDPFAPAVCAAAGTLNCLARSIPPHLGQWAVSPLPRIKVSKVWSHGSQWYS